jgi:predicted hotdog family 3-hydroxylacyl-ACP dehydratase
MDIYNTEIGQFLPHAGKMILLDRIVDFDDEQLQTESHIKPDNLFADELGNVPSWVGIEYMAQCVAAFAGIKARLKGEAVKLGFLIGARSFEASQPYFQAGSTIKIQIKELHLEESGLAVFDCQISAENMSISCRLNVFQPADPEKFFKDNQL